jgi:MiaB-like tRNA modifying enzyme
MNQGEAKIMEDIVNAKGHEVVFDESNGDVLVLVTCTVIETTERKMLKRLSEFSKTGKLVIVGGCMASVQWHKILNSNPDALILTPQYLKDIGKIADILNQENKKSEKKKQPIDSDVKTADAIIPISSGCLGTCTYCITHVARGTLKSHPPDLLISSMKSALENGFKEIRLSSQDTAAYGADIESNLADLLKQIGTIEGEFRVRVGMMNPENLKPIINDVVEAYKDPRVYKFLHVPVQSGNEEVLNRMGRRYTISEFFEVITSFRSSFPNLTVSTDVIVGFPGESDSEFRDTVKVVKRLQPNILNVTRFSPRPKTLAKDMEDKIPSRIAKDRSRELARLHLEISRNINETLVGSKERILITEPGKTKTMMGRTNSYLPVVVSDDATLCDFVDVKITEARDTYLMGKMI